MIQLAEEFWLRIIIEGPYAGRIMAWYSPDRAIILDENGSATEVKLLDGCPKTQYMILNPAAVGA